MTEFIHVSGIDPAKISKAPWKLIEEAVDALRLPLRDKIALTMTLVEQRDGPTKETGVANQHNDGIAHYWRQRDLERAFPWRIDDNRATVQIEAVRKNYREANSFDKLRMTFIASAKAGLLTEVEAAVCHHLLFHDDGDFGRFFLASLMLHVPSVDRAPIHNWFVASTMSQARKEAHGSAIANLGVTLFPDVPELSALNSRLMAAQNPVGGDANRTDIFREEQPRDVEGGGSLPIINNNGQHYLETTPLENAFQALSNQIQLIAQQRGSNVSQRQQPQQRRANNQGNNQGHNLVTHQTNNFGQNRRGQGGQPPRYNARPKGGEAQTAPPQPQSETAGF
jgi:hypothetical protein